MRGGARKGTGPKVGPDGKRIDKTVSLPSVVWAFLKSGDVTASSAIETYVRKTTAFKNWRQQNDHCN